MVYRISFLGVSNSGKSYQSLRICNQLKTLGHNVEFIEEPFKDWAFEKRRLPGIAEEVEGFGIQLRKETSRLHSGSSIVTDAGLISICWYLYKMVADVSSFVKIVADMEHQYRSINILLPPRDIPWSPGGRWFKHSVDKDNNFQEFKKFLDDWSIPYHTVGPDVGSSVDEILEKELGLIGTR